MKTAELIELILRIRPCVNNCNLVGSFTQERREELLYRIDQAIKEYQESEKDHFELTPDSVAEHTVQHPIIKQMEAAQKATDKSTLRFGPATPSTVVETPMTTTLQEPVKEQTPKVWFPSQCACGHLFLEKYILREPNEKGEIGFCWCGFCRTKLMVKSLGELIAEPVKEQKSLCSKCAKCEKDGGCTDSSCIEHSNFQPLPKKEQERNCGTCGDFVCNEGEPEVNIKDCKSWVPKAVQSEAKQPNPIAELSGTQPPRTVKRTEREVMKTCPRCNHKVIETGLYSWWCPCCGAYKL